MQHPIQSFVLAGVVTLGASLTHASAQFAPPAVLPGDTALAPPAGDQTHVVFARGATSTLMVWEDSRASLAGTQSAQGYGFGTQITDVYAARIDDAGGAIDVSPILVATGPFSESAPRVAWNGQCWLVVWTARKPGQYFSTLGVYGARISPAGQVLDTPPITISDTTEFDEREAVVASNGTSWAVVWKAGIAFATDAVRGSLVSAIGAVDAPRTFFQTVDGVGFYIPWNFELAFAGGHFLFISEHMRSGRGDDDILGQLFDANLDKIGAEFPISTNDWNQNRAGIASNGSEFFVTWVDEQMWGEVRGSPVSAAGIVAAPDGRVFQTAMYGSYPSPAAGWDGANWIVAWDGSGPIAVARVSPSGTMLPGSPFAVNAGTWSMLEPAVASLGAGALVGWADSRNVVSPIGPDSTDLYGVVVAPSGTLSTNRALQLSPPAQTRPSVAGNAASGYLVTFLSETSGTASVMAQRVDAEGAPLDPQPVVVASGTRWVRDPAVAFDGSTWLVAWEVATDAWPPGSGTVYARRIGLDGVPIDSAPIQVMPGNAPDVAAVGGVFLVIGSVEPTNHIRYIRGARVRSSDGAVLDPSPIQIGNTYAVSPSISAFADRWLVAWQQHTTHDSPYSSVYASFVLAGGTALPQFVAGNNTSTCRTPAVAVAGSTALVSWADGTNIRARRIDSDGTAPDPSAGFAVATAFNNQFAPEVGSDGARWLVAWNDYRAHTNILDGGVGDLYAARVDADGTSLDPDGLAVANDFAVPEANPAVAGDLGRAVAVYAMVRAEAPFGTFRVTVRRADGSSPMLAFCFGDGTLATPCPCANTGAPGRGCANSANPGGAMLAASGGTNPDTIVLTSSGELPSVLSIFMQGDTALSGVVFGDGLRCTAGAIKRLGAVRASSGTASYPAVASPSITARSASLGDPISAGDVRYYQTYYRDPDSGFCPGAMFNVSNGVEIRW